MKLAAEVPTTKKLVEEVKKVATQSTADVAITQVELRNLHRKVVMTAK